MTPMRRAAQSAIERSRGFLKVDRGDALYLTDAALKSPERAMEIRRALNEAGFAVQERGAYWGLIPQEAWYEKMAQALRKDGLSPLRYGLYPLRGREILPEERALWIRCVKAFELNRPVEALERALREQAAQCLRLKRGGGLLYDCACIIDGRKEK